MLPHDSMPELARLNTLVEQLIALRKEDREEDRRVREADREEDRRIREEDREEDKQWRKDIKDAVAEIRQEAQRTTARINSHETELIRLSLRLEALQKEYLELAARSLRQDEVTHKEIAKVNDKITVELHKIDGALQALREERAGVKGGAKVAGKVAGWLWQAITVILSGSIGAAIWAALAP